MNYTLKRAFVLITLLLAVTMGHAQCSVENTAFQSGERLEYELYFNWKFVWLHAGRASLTTTDARWTDGTEAYRSRLSRPVLILSCFTGVWQPAGLQN